MKRVCYQFGSLEQKARKNGPDVWVYRFRENGTKRSTRVGTVDEYPTEALAWKAAEVLRLAANPDHPDSQVTFGALLDRYIKEEIPQRHSTKTGYQSYIRTHIRPKWGTYPISKVTVLGLDVWLKGLPLGAKTRNNIKWLMVSIFDYAIRLELMPLGRNPMRAIKVKGITADRKQPKILTAEQFQALAAAVKDEPYRTAVFVAGCLGLRCSEIAGLQWGDFDFIQGKVVIMRAVVQGRVDKTKTLASSAELPVHSALSAKLLMWREKSKYKATTDWVFASPYWDGKTPLCLWNAQRLILKPAAKSIGLVDIGWHTLRHTYRAMLDKTGAPAGAQQKLMRHASITTTMNTYGDAYMEEKRIYNEKLVDRLLQ
jgi:integrase